MWNVECGVAKSSQTKGVKHAIGREQIHWPGHTGAAGGTSHSDGLGLQQSGRRSPCVAALRSRSRSSRGSIVSALQHRITGQANGGASAVQRGAAWSVERQRQQQQQLLPAVSRRGQPNQSPALWSGGIAEGCRPPPRRLREADSLAMTRERHEITHRRDYFAPTSHQTCTQVLIS
jgi:hypothetical protein